MCSVSLQYARISRSILEDAVSVACVLQMKLFYMSDMIYIYTSYVIHVGLNMNRALPFLQAEGFGTLLWADAWICFIFAEPDSQSGMDGAAGRH